jgi:ribose 5-phosphate isomerase B
MIVKNCLIRLFKPFLIIFFHFYNEQLYHKNPRLSRWIKDDIIAKVINTYMLYIASDHAGFQLKKFLLQQFKNTLKIKVTDLGPKVFDSNDDFPDFASLLAKKVVKKNSDRGILICGSGHGMCIAANKIKGARAILGSSIEGTDLGRRDNDANILCLPGRIVSPEHAIAIVKHFLEVKFDNQERRVRRLKKISALEK